MMILVLVVIFFLNISIVLVICSKECSIGMVLPLWSDTNIHLDGDG